MVAISGGTALEKRLAEIARGLKQAAEVDIGFLDTATYPDGRPVALVAAMNEFGTEKAPPRPFFRAMIQDKSGEWPDAVAGLLVATDYNTERTFTQVGAAIKGQLQESIATFVGAPLAPATIARKGHEKQLVDSGVMLNSVDYRVK